MNDLEAAAALATVHRTEEQLAQRARWSFRRHAMFGLVEGLIIAGLAQPIVMGGAMAAGAMALLVTCIMEDRRKQGMFVSGWQPRSTRPMMFLLCLLLLAAVIGAVLLRNGGTVEPWGFALGAVVAIVCTLASLRWEKLYRAELMAGASR